MKRNQQKSSYYNIESNYGHDAFLVEIDKFNTIIKEKLEH
jgi:homoserine O-acetyltransferase